VCNYIERAIYDSRDVGRDPRLHLRYCMAQIAVQLSKSNQDVLFRPAVERDGFEYTEYALLYVDIVLVISGNAEQVLRNEIGLEAEGSSIANRCCIWENTVENWI